MYQKLIYNDERQPMGIVATVQKRGEGDVIIRAETVWHYLGIDCVPITILR